jgi:hypothetical protein
LPTSCVPPDLALAIERAPYEVLGQKLDLLKLDRRRLFARKPCPDYCSLSLVHRCRSGFDGSAAYRSHLSARTCSLLVSRSALHSASLTLASDVSSSIRTS